MTSRTIRIGFWTLVTLSAITILAMRNVDSINRWITTFREQEVLRVANKYGKDLPPIDEIRISRFTETQTSPNQRKVSSWLTDGSPGYVVEEKTISGKDAEHLAHLWRSLTLYTNSSMCFDPHHVIEFRSSGKTVCEAVTCFWCQNTRISSFPFPTLMGIYEEPVAGRSPLYSPVYDAFRKTVEALVGAADKGPSQSK